MIYSERELIPYEPGDLPPGPWLVFAPHPDDEVFGMGGTLILGRNAGIAADVVYVTDGARGGNGGDPNAVIAVRRSEAESACRYLNVRSCHFWQQPDRGLVPDEALLQRVAALVTEISPASVFIPSVLEPHPDHRATTKMVWNGLRKIDRFDGRIIAYDICSQGPVNTIIDITPVIEEKHTLMALYESQVKDGGYVPVVTALDTARTFTLPRECQAAEGFYRFPAPGTVSLERSAFGWLRRFLEISGTGRPLVSVIVRTRDRRELLREALASVAAQDHPRIELVVVNDGDTEVADIVDLTSQELESYRYLRTGERRGRSAAANLGLENAAGDYFLFLDDDDWIDPPHVSKLVGALADDPGALVAYTGVRAVTEDRKEVRIFDQPFDRNRMFFDNFIPIHAALVSRSVIDAGIRFDESLDIFEDWDFWLQVMQRTVAFARVAGISAGYRVDRGGGIGVNGGYDRNKRLIYARWSKTWGLDEIDDFMTRLTSLSREDAPERQ